jgi:membrane protease YdiL (CAAX protease family)
MNLDKFWSILGVAILVIILGILLTLGITLPLSASTQELIADNSYINTAILVLTFVVSFSVVLYFFRKNTTNKKSLAKKFSLLFFVFYGLNVFADYQGLTTLFVAILFPVLAYLLTSLIVVERNSLVTAK